MERHRSSETTWPDIEVTSEGDWLEKRGPEKLEVPEDEEEDEERRLPSLITACREAKVEMVQQLLTSGADVTLCDSNQETALHVSPPELQRKMLEWMRRPDLPPQTQLLQAAWQGDIHTLQQLLTGADSLDVNAPNGDGVTALMLSVRDIDLFEDMVTWLPWDHRPVEVVKALLGVEADVQQPDRSGCSALHHAASINSPVKEEIMHMMIEVLHHRDAASSSSSSPVDKYSPHGPDSDFEDCDTEVDCGSPSPHPSTAASPTLMHHLQPGLLLYHDPEEVLDSRFSPQPDLDKDVSQADKGIPLCLQNTMETLTDIGPVHQGRRSSRGLCLPSLNNSRSWSRVDPVSSGGLLSTNTSCIPIPPIQRPRTKSVLTVSHLSPSRLTVGHLSQSAPSIMEPLLGSNTMMQARVHIHNRLVSQDNEHKFSRRPILSLTPRTPKQLAPLNRRLTDTEAQPVLKQHLPLKPISCGSLRSRAWLRRERLPQSSSGTGSVAANKGGSEESSSQSSTDLEDEERDSISEDNHHFVKDRLSQHWKDLSSTNLVNEVNTYKSQIPPIQKPGHNLEGESCGHTAAFHFHCEGTAIDIKRPVENFNSMNPNGETVNSKITSSSGTDEEENDVGCHEETIGDHRNDLKTIQQREEETLTAELHSDEHPESNMSSAVRKSQQSTGHTNYQLTFMNVEKKFKCQNTDGSRETTTTSKHHKLKASTNVSLNKSSSHLKRSSLSIRIKDKARKTAELFVSGEATVKVKPSSTHNSTDASVPQEKVDHSEGIMEKSKAPVRDLKCSQRINKQSVAGTQRFKSALDFITYSDMFQKIQSVDGGPAIYEMFAGPIYDNLRISSSSVQTKDRHPQSVMTRKTQQSHKPKHKMFRQPQVKLRRIPGESMVVLTKSKVRSSKAASRKDCAAKVETELVFSEQEKGPKSAQQFNKEDPLPITKEALSRHEFETLKSDDQKLRTQTTAQDVRGHHVTPGTTSTEKEKFKSDPKSLSPQPKINSWTSSRSNNTMVSPVFQRFLDEVGDGPPTDDLLQCLAEELISLEERDASQGLSLEHHDASETASKREDSVTGTNSFPELISTDRSNTLGCGADSENSITWTKGEMLGRGAYGTVYCGLTNQGQLIAVKQVSLDTSNPKDAKGEYSRLQEEVELLKTLRHINIVGFLGTSLYQHVVSIFMEYVPGGSIASILHRFGPLPERVLALYTQQILEGVAFLHLNRVIHRDLKGNNVMLMPTGVIKLIDFGCARRLSYVNHTGSNSGDLLKSVHGTPYWMAPEVINETGYGSKSDIWSVGCTVFEMATGKPPLAHMNRMAALFFIGAQSGLMPSLPDGFSEHAKNFVQFCLTSDQRLRPSAEQLLRHSFLPRNQTGVSNCRTRNCCCHSKGQCG